MKPPIFVDESGDIAVFGSVSDAERYLEPIDVENEEYVAYDSEGRLLSLIATFHGVTIQAAEDKPTHALELTDKLRRFLIVIGTPQQELEKESLQELVARLLKYKIE